MCAYTAVLTSTVHLECVHVVSGTVPRLNSVPCTKVKFSHGTVPDTRDTAVCTHKCRVNTSAVNMQLFLFFSGIGAFIIHNEN